ncbi:MAG: tyrosine-type recombinase/integrase [Alphaproteobacteria bacterium]|nr:tyrosine-type recombinase/integrase [Alphaproteobacteria bacterium]
MKLTNIKCQTAKFSPDGKGNKLADGAGLYLHLQEQGKYWRMNYRFLGKQKTLSFGTYPLISLAEAREKRDAAKKQLDRDQDPMEVKKLRKLELHTNYENNFEAIAREWHQHKFHTWKPDHAERILKRLEADVFPKIGKRPISGLTPPELLEAVRQIEARGHCDLAHRALQTCGQVFRYAVATGRAQRDITPDLRGALKPTRSKNLAFLKESELPAFLHKLERYEEDYGGKLLTKLAFKLLILTFPRSSEIRKATWDEINFEKAEWRIPAERMKMKDQHIVPLAPHAVALLKEIYQLSGNSFGNFLFPSQHGTRKPMSENTFLRVIEVLGYKGKTVGHGFRSTASTVLNENGFRGDVIERQLAHCERNQIRAAYNHAEYLAERRQMMNWWADYVENIIKGKKCGKETTQKEQIAHAFEDGIWHQREKLLGAL